MSNAKLDANRIPTIMGVSSVDLETPTPIAVNPETGAIQAEANVVGTTPSWGDITGTLSDQTDLQAALDAKASLAGATFTGDITLNSATPTITTGTDKNLNLVPNGTGFTVIGDAGTTSHTLNTNDDLLVTGRLEVNSACYFDLGAFFGPDQNLMLNNTSCGFTSRSTGAQSDTLFVMSGDTDKSVIISLAGLRTKDFDHGAQTNPTLYVQSATDPDTDNTEWVSITHDTTNGILNTGKGNLSITPAGGVVAITGALSTTSTITSSGVVTINQASDANALVVNATHSGATNNPAVLVKGDNTADKLFQFGLSTDTSMRVNITAGGTIELGPGGSSARDTNLYRSAADTLKTDDTFVAVNIPAGSFVVKWNEVTGTTQAMAVNNSYIANNASQVVLTLPDTAALGSQITVTGLGAGGWKIAQNASEIIHFGNVDTTTGTSGYLESMNRYDSVTLVCVVANTEWSVIASQGTLVYN